MSRPVVGPALTMKSYVNERRVRCRRSPRRRPDVAPRGEGGVCASINRAFSGCLPEGFKFTMNLDRVPSACDSAAASTSSSSEIDESLKKKNMVTIVDTNDMKTMMNLYHFKRHQAGENPQKIESLNNELNCALLQAITTRRLQMVELLLTLCPDVDRACIPCMGVYPISRCAVQSNCEEIVDIFIERRIKFVSLADDESSTVLHIAARSGNENILRKLLELKQVHVNSQEKRNGNCDLGTALHCAVQHRNAGCVELLLEHEADANISDSQGQTPLHMAAISGHNNIVQKLLNHGADAELPDIQGSSAIFKALQYHHMTTVELLERHLEKTCGGVNWRDPYLFLAIKMGCNFPVEYLLSSGCDVTRRNALKQTVLMQAVSSRATLSTCIVRKLLSHKLCAATINEVDENDDTALSLLVKQPWVRDCEERIGSLLLAAGADINRLMPDRNPDFNSLPLVFRCLDEAMLSENLRKFNFFVKHGANLNFDFDGRNLLNFALSCSGSQEAVNTMLLNNIDVGLTKKRCSKLGPGLCESNQHWTHNGAFPMALQHPLELVEDLYHSGCVMEDVEEYARHNQSKLVPGMVEFVSEVVTAGRAQGPLALVEEARQAVLRALGNGDKTATKHKISQLGLPRKLADYIVPYCFQKDDHIS